MKTIISYFKESSIKHRNKVAVVYKERKLTYGELDELTDKLACLLRCNYAINRGDIVPIMLERSENTIIAMLGVLKAGACYTILSKDLPTMRKKEIERQINPKVIIEESIIQESQSMFKNDILSLAIEPHDTSYIVFTSGTTGKPKGVVHTHKSVVSHIISYGEAIGIDKSNAYNMLLLVNFAFSVSTPQVYGALFFGHTLFISEENALFDISALRCYIQKNMINYFFCTPSIAESLEVSKLSSVSMIAVAGEKLTETLYNQTVKNSVRLVNMYGQSEFHAGTIKEVRCRSDVNKIGQTIGTMNAYVLNDEFKEVREGEVGEIFFSGDQLAKEYLGDIHSTNKSFVSLQGYRETLCKTGDLVRKLSNAEFEFIGRKDFQININGIRVEPEEIEMELLKINGIRKALVIGQDGKNIVAYYTGEKEILEEIIREGLNANLPSYMIPDMFVYIKEFPINANGKIDRHKILNASVSDIVILPKTEQEKELISMIEKVLGIEKIGVNGNFFKLGGNSLKGIRLINLIEQNMNKRIELDDLYKAVNIEELTKIIEGRNQVKVNSLATLISKQPKSKMSIPQKKLFIASELNQNKLTYQEVITVNLGENVDIDKLKKCFEKLVRNNRILRSKYYVEDDDYIQEVLDFYKVDFEIIECNQYTPSVAMEHVKTLDITSGQTMQVCVFINGSDKILMVNKHHIITDAFSEELFYQKLGEYYESDDEISHSLIDYNEYVQSNCKLDKQSWWRNNLSDSSYLKLNENYVYTNHQRKSCIRTSLPDEIVRNLRIYSKKMRISEHSVLLASSGILFARMYFNHKFTIGTVLNGRYSNQAEKVLGLLSDAVPFKVDLKTNERISGFINKVQEQLFNMIKNYTYLSEEAGKEPLADQFDFILVYQKVSKRSFLNKRIEYLALKESAPKYPLSFEIVDDEKNIDLIIEYNGEFLNKSTVELLYKKFIFVLENVMKVSSNSLITTLSLLSDDERENMLKISEPFDRRDVVEIFEYQVRRFPDRVAIQDTEFKITYKELNEKVNNLANFLIMCRNVKKGQTIPVMLDRSYLMVVTILAILKAGAIYVPISLKNPPQRIESILSNLKFEFIIDKSFMRQNFPERDYNPGIKVDGSELAYIIFTSGTTGSPKGVKINRKGLSNYVCAMLNRDIDSDDTHVNGAFLDYGFDASLHDLVRTFTSGETMVLLGESELFDIEKLLFKLVAQKVSSIALTPSLIEKIPLYKVPTLRRIFCGGEPLSQELLNKYSEYPVEINNCYGPTETAVQVFMNKNTKNIDIGYPLAGVYPYVLAEDLCLLPNGAIGELYIGGSQVGDGYLNNLEETYSNFIENPYGRGFLYKTGDLVRRLENGCYQYIGRKDNQVKLRGYRIELGEIESSIRQIEGVIQTTVVVREDTLVAYCVLSKDIKPEDIKTKLEQILPDYMLPSFYIEISEIPLTINGKIDVKKLPLPTYEEVCVLPVTSREKEIERAFSQVLNLEKVSTEANFFQLGGNSLKAILLANQINLPVKTIFERKTVKNLAKERQNYLKVEKQDFPMVKDQVLSSKQRKFYLLNQLKPNGAYNIPILLKIRKGTNVERLEKALIQLVQRHEVLRTIVHAEYQEVLDVDLRITHEQIDYSSYFMQDFDLSHEIPIRANIFADILAISIHHIALDGWAQRMLLEELSKLYKETKLEELSIQYKDFSKWESEHLDETYLASQKKYWLEMFEDSAPFELPIDYVRPKIFDFIGEQREQKIDEDVLNKLEKLAHNKGKSMYAILLSAFYVLMFAYGNQEDIVIGMPTANRHIRGVEKMIGCFVNTLALRMKLDTNITFETFLDGVSQELIEAQQNQDYPFEKVVNDLKIERDLSRNPLFQIMFVYDEFPRDLDCGLFDSMEDDIWINRAKFDLTAIVKDGRITFNYATSLFNPRTIDVMLETYQKILSQIVDNPHLQIKDMVFNELKESKAILCNQEDTLVNLFEKQAGRNGNEIALVWDTQQITYRELNEKANQVAYTLREVHGVGEGDRIPILMNRGIEYVVFILGVLKAGAAYVPLDINMPQKRVDYICQQVKAPFILTASFSITSTKRTNLALSILPQSLAYVIFTSGTTGTPKGVKIAHSSVVNTIHGQIKGLGLCAPTKVLHFANFVFDASVSELFISLLTGSTLYIASEDERKDYMLLRYFVEQKEIKCATLPPAILNSQELVPLEVLIVAGESTALEIYQAYHNQGTRVINAYGPTEVAICATMKEYAEGMHPNNIGRPFDNVSTYVMNENLQLVPTGGIGELYVGGNGLAQGYIGADEEGIFIVHEQYGRLYKTGDLVREQTNGELVYIGRKDNQVKLRGYRIELGEIESSIRQIEGVIQTTVVVREDTLVAYCVLSKD
ncbi:amino acid adenylation domain-containing protein, partial [Aerococcaceae bacterium NML191292]|nr:amino acid adenylation domain-containing protein [Aerococcaceae bacterium NML191292]